MDQRASFLVLTRTLAMTILVRHDRAPSAALPAWDFPAGSVGTIMRRCQSKRSSKAL
jgi:hypothetical protein